MPLSIPEKDWKYLRGINADLLNKLCSRINQETTSIINKESKSDHEKYLQVYKHIEKSDNIIAECFNDWRRSDILIKIRSLCQHKILTSEHIKNFSGTTLEYLKTLEEITKE